MATRIREAPRDDALRAELAARWRELSEMYPQRLGVPPEKDPYLRRADAIDRGEPVVVAGWQLPEAHRPLARSQSRDYTGEFFVVEPDGTLRVAERGADIFDATIGVGG